MKEVINSFFKDSNLKVLIVGVYPWAIERMEILNKTIGENIILMLKYCYQFLPLLQEYSEK